MTTYESWGRNPTASAQKIYELPWRTSPLPTGTSLLSYGLGKSYGDACLNNGGTLISTKRLNHFIAFNAQTGVLACETGVTLAEILALVVPHGWFLPVTPGIKYITVGGAIANEVHGKNHYRAGTFCHHLTKFELLRSDGSRLTCSPQENNELFRATCGGIGLTGLITWAEMKLKPIRSAYLESESVRTSGLGEVLNMFQELSSNYEYMIASINTNKSGEKIGAGYMLLGNHSQKSDPRLSQETVSVPRITIPAPLPFSLVNRLSATMFNALYYSRQLKKISAGSLHYDPFFYPQDAIGYWNYAYGPRGFLQYQCQVPAENAEAVLGELLQTVKKSGFVSFLTTLKKLGPQPSIGHLAFPHEGYTLALDFPHTGKNLLDMFSQLDEIVMSANGRLYLAKDARMPQDMFQKTYPAWTQMKPHLDPAFSSTMWRRLTAGVP